MAKIQINHLTYQPDGSQEPLFEDLNLVLDTDWKLGLIGRNGIGKTTFLKLLTQQEKYQGNIINPVEMEYFPFTIQETQKMTLEILEKQVHELEDWKVIKELNLLQTDPEILYRPFYTLSGGEQMKVMLACLFSKEHCFLLLDEPTNHLDEETKKQIENYLKQKKAYILVSHDRKFLDNTVDHILAIQKKAFELVKGNYSVWKENNDKRNQFETMQNQKLKQEILKLEKASQNTANWSDQVEKTKLGDGHVDKGYIGHKAAKMMKVSKGIEKRKQRATEQKRELLQNLDKTDNLTLKPLKYEKKELIFGKDFSIKQEGKSIHLPIDFVLERNDRLAIMGKNGIGKSSFLKLLLGEKIDYEGYIQVGKQMKISYVSQHTDYLADKTIKQVAKENNLDESVFKAMLVKLDISSKEFYKKIANLSQGQQKKVLLAKSITESADLYLWDEPFNYIDIPSRIQIEEAILKYQPTMIFVEHDKTFIEKIATKKIKLEKR